MSTTPTPNDLTTIPPAYSSPADSLSGGAENEAARRRQAQLATPPPLSWLASGASPASSRADPQPASDEVIIQESASLSLPDALAFKRILVPLDGSERAERAIPVAARIARASQARDTQVLLARVVSPQVMETLGVAPVETSVETELDAASLYLERATRREELAGLEVQSEALRGVSAAMTLLAAIEQYDCDLVVICGHGRSGLMRWALGSIAQKLVQRASVPVLVLRPDEVFPPAADGSHGPAVRALVALDESPLAEAALVPAARLVAALAGTRGGEVHLLRVLDQATIASQTPVLPYRDPADVAREDARTYLYRVAQRLHEGELAKLGLRVSWSMREDPDAACGILDAAEGDAAEGDAAEGDAAEGDAAEGDAAEGDAMAAYDLIAMATHGRSGLKLWTMGSVADRVLQTTRLPLLVVRPPESAEGAGHARHG